MTERGHLVKYPSLEESQKATLVEGEHFWIAWKPKSAAADRPPMITCRWCMAIKRRGGNKPCPGIVKVQLL